MLDAPHQSKIPLKAATPPGWAEHVRRDLAGFMQDHAACEKKAAALAISMLCKYPDRKALIEPMTALAREELDHFGQVYRLMQRRRIPLAANDERDGYVNRLLAQLRHGRDTRFLDRLVASGLIEARGCERFGLLGESLAGEDQELAAFYRHLSLREAGHYQVFLRVARHYFPEDEVDEVQERLATAESEVMLSTPFTHRLH